MIEFIHVSKEYEIGEQKVIAVNDVNFTMEEGEFVVILGPSGAGKSTILNLLGGMDQVTKGSILIDGIDITKYSDHELTSYRGTEVGFVFQFYNLIPSLTVLENVKLVYEVAKKALSAEEVLDKVGLKNRLHQFPNQISGGEQQRVSIARAVCKNPKLLLCDEPTGALDTETGIKILSVLQEMSHLENRTVIIVTHNESIARGADKIIRCRDGKVVSVVKQQTPSKLSEVTW